MSVKGITEPVQQVGSTYLVKSDGLIEASLTFTQIQGSDQPESAFDGPTSGGNIASTGQGSNVTSGADTGAVSGQTNTSSVTGLPSVGGEHPNNPNLKCTRRTVVYGESGITTTTCDFLGIDGEETERFLAYTGGVNSESIEAHPRFDEIGGTPVAPKNGAIFDANNQFQGFDTTGAMSGEQNYYAPGATVEVTYYTYTQPTLENRMKIFDSPQMGDQYFQKPDPKTINYLLTDTPYREVIPGSGLYQVTEQYLQSEEYGWNVRLYDEYTEGE